MSPNLDILLWGGGGTSKVVIAKAEFEDKLPLDVDPVKQHQNRIDGLDIDPVESSAMQTLVPRRMRGSIAEEAQHVPNMSGTHRKGGKNSAGGNYGDGGSIAENGPGARLDPFTIDSPSLITTGPVGLRFEHSEPVNW